MGQLVCTDIHETEVGRENRVKSRRSIYTRVDSKMRLGVIVILVWLATAFILLRLQRWPDLDDLPDENPPDDQKRLQEIGQDPKIEQPVEEPTKAVAQTAGKYS